jgi:hypothetical protein
MHASQFVLGELDMAAIAFPDTAADPFFRAMSDCISTDRQSIGNKK